MGARPVLGAAALLVALTGCGSGDGKPTPSPGAVAQSPLALQVGPARDFGNACRLLTPAEMQSTLGTGAVAAPRSDPQLGSFCTYTPASGGSSVPLLTVQVEVLRSPAAARLQVDQTGGPVLGGVGDAARISKPGGLGIAVYLARGATYAVLSSSHRDVTEQMLTRLAGILAGRL